MSDLTPEDEALLRRARQGGLAAPSDQARVKRKLFGRLGIGIGVGTSALSASSGASAGIAGGGAAATGGALAFGGKIVAGVLIVGGVGVFAWALAPRSNKAQNTASRQTPSLATPSSRLSVLGSAKKGTQAPRRVASAALAAAAARPPTPHATPHAIRRAARESATGLAPKRAPANPAPLANASSGAVIARTTATPLPAGPDTVEAEAALLRKADAARKAGHAARALVLLDQHRARFPEGVLSEECEAERVVVLCALGRTNEARTTARRFLHSYPHSPLAVRIRASCGGS